MEDISAMSTPPLPSSGSSAAMLGLAEEEPGFPPTSHCTCDVNIWTPHCSMCCHTHTQAAPAAGLVATTKNSMCVYACEHYGVGHPPLLAVMTEWTFSCTCVPAAGMAVACLGLLSLYSSQTSPTTTQALFHSLCGVGRHGMAWRPLPTCALCDSLCSP